MLQFDLDAVKPRQMIQLELSTGIRRTVEYGSPCTISTYLRVINDLNADADVYGSLYLASDSDCVKFLTREL